MGYANSSVAILMRGIATSHPQKSNFSTLFIQLCIFVNLRNRNECNGNKINEALIDFFNEIRIWSRMRYTHMMCLRFELIINVIVIVVNFLMVLLVKINTQLI